MSSIIDPLVAALFFIGFGFAALISLTVFNGIASSGLFGQYFDAANQFYTAINNVAIFIMIGAGMAAVFAGLLIKTHPAFFFIAIILVFVEFLIVPSLVNAFNTVAQSAPMTASANQMYSLVTLIQYLPITTAVFTLLAALAGLMFL